MRTARMMIACFMPVALGCNGSQPPTESLYVSYIRSSVGDSGTSMISVFINIRTTGELQVSDGTRPLVDRTIDQADKQRFARIVGAPGALATLLSDAPCGTPLARTSEFLYIGTSDGQMHKEISGCQGAPYADLRAFLVSLPEKYLKMPSGTCAAPNVWRYMSPGCGAEAHPVCGTRQQDACAAARCSCDGRDIDGCDYTSEPYAHVGRCSGSDGAADRPPDAGTTNG